MDYEHFREDCVVDNLRWAFQRVTNFILGMAIAPYVKQEKRVNLLPVLGACLMAFFLVHWLVSKDLFMNWCKVPYLIAFFVLILRHIKKDGVVHRFIYWMGLVSLESYLANIYLCGAVSDYAQRVGWNDYGRYAEYLMVIVWGIAISWGVHQMAGLVRKKY